MAESLKSNNLERLIVKHIDNIISHDIALGRDKNNFFKEEYTSVMQVVEAIRKDNGRVFAGGGNVFMLKIEKSLMGWKANLLQIRGLAQRKIIFEERII